MILKKKNRQYYLAGVSVKSTVLLNGTKINKISLSRFSKNQLFFRFFLTLNYTLLKWHSPVVDSIINTLGHLSAKQYYLDNGYKSRIIWYNLYCILQFHSFKACFLTLWWLLKVLFNLGDSYVIKCIFQNWY